MARYRDRLVSLSDCFLTTDGGLETILMYKEGVKLPCFATYPLLEHEAGREWIKTYCRSFIDIAYKYNIGFLLGSVTWRANPDWMKKLGYSDQDIIDINRQAIKLISDIRDEYNEEKYAIILTASIGPRGDGYKPSMIMSSEEAQAYHSVQIKVLQQTNVDLITAMTLNYPEEAIGIVRAAQATQMPVVISFTIDNDGKLPTGQTLKEAIELVDQATNSGPIYYMVNCIHPTYLKQALHPGGDWTDRIQGIRCNASKKSHSELDEAKELDEGDAIEFGEQCRELLNQLKNLNVIGGCCGTNQSHIEEICKSCIGQWYKRRTKHS